MELRHLRYFVAVAEELNVRQAATRLHLSQPPLSRQIHDLEDEVGTKLFVRSQSGMRLTEAGRTFLKEARSILAQSQRAVQLAQAASRGEAGHLEIAYAVVGFEPVLLRVIRLFRQLFPMVEIGIRELQYHQQIQELLNQRIDIGYVGIRFPELESELVFECVRKAPFLVALPPGHPLAKQRRLRLSELANERFISIRQTAAAYHSRFVSHCRSAGFEPEIAPEEADGTLSMLGLVSAGFGVALVPETFQQILPVEVEFRPLRPSIPTFDFHIAWRRDNQSSVLHSFLEMLRKHAHAEAKGPEKNAVARHSDRNLHSGSQREVGAGKSDGKTNTNGR
jgi:DNA-binding transcriptional LysR family regulator